MIFVRAERKAALAAKDGDAMETSDASGEEDGEVDLDAEDEQLQSEIQQLRRKKMQE